jgi:hypothetical protein
MLNMTILIIFMVISTISIVVLSVLLYKSLKREKKGEEIIIGYLEYLDKISKTIEVADKKLEVLDKLDAFKNDDETGFIFEQIKKLQEILSSFRLKHK